jgi:ferric-dicitrate binding protein FerR (iron transport regulator)
VVEGRVAFYTKEAEENRTILNKGDQAELKDGIIRLRARPDPNFLSWQTGILNFRRSPIEEVVTQLEKHYHRKIFLDNSIPRDMTFTSTIDNQGIEDVLDEISLVLELIITYNPDTIIISKQY